MNKKIFCLLLLLSCMFVGCGESISRDMTKKDGHMMMDYVREFVKISPRDSGSVNAGKASQWLCNEIKKNGLIPYADTWTELTYSGWTTFSNIYTELPGVTDKVIIVGCHYDTKRGVSEDFQGANDGGSTVGVILGLMKHLKRNKVQFNHTIRFAFFDGEECAGDTYADDDGLHGSNRMAKSFLKTDAPKLTATIIIDMVGDRNQHFVIPRNVTPWLATELLNVASTIKDPPRISLASRGTWVVDDHLPFIENGFSAINLIDLEYLSDDGKTSYWHTKEDTVDKLSEESLLKTAIIVDALIQKIDLK